MIDTESEAGAWAKALPYCRNIRILEDTRASTTHSPRAETSGAAVLNPDAAPPLSNSVHSPQIL